MTCRGDADERAPQSALAAVPPLGPPRQVPPLPIRDERTVGGLRLVTVQGPTVPAVELRLVTPLDGAAADRTARATLLAAMVQRRLRADTPRRRHLDRYGGELLATADARRFAVVGAVLREGLSAALDVLAWALVSGAYSDEEVEAERARLCQQAHAAHHDPAFVARRALQRLRYGDHPVACETPEPEQLSQLTAIDAAQIHRRTLIPGRAILVLVGALPDDTSARVEAALASWTASAIDPTPPPSLPTARTGQIALVHRPAAVQSQVRLAAENLDPRDPRYPASKVANAVLGGSFSSRLVRRLREDLGLSYNVRSMLESSPDRSSVLIAMDCATESTSQALRALGDELKGLRTRPPSPAEVESARRHVLGSMRLNITQADLANVIAGTLVDGRDPRWRERHAEALAAVTPADIEDVVRAFFAPEAFGGVVVGDSDRISGPLRGLGYPAVIDWPEGTPSHAETPGG